MKFRVILALMIIPVVVLVAMKADFLLTAPALADVPVRVREITMATPDVIRIEVVEAPVHLGKLVKLPKPGEYGKEYRLEDGVRGLVVGKNSDFVRTYDLFDAARLNRTSVDRVDGYGKIGGLSVTAIYRKSIPWSSGRLMDGKSVSSFQHFIYLKLSGVLKNGRYKISWPDDIIPPTDFDFDDRHTRASSILANQNGYGRNDDSKYAYLAQWLPGPSGGVPVAFGELGVEKFSIIDGEGKAVFNGQVNLRIGPQDSEYADGINGDLVTYTNEDGSKFLSNRSGTYVYGLDFSNFNPEDAGTYRIYISGLGVSDAFVIGPDIWYDAAKVSMGGLYNQRSGMALDGRFGYKRPECFTEASGVQVRQSLLPYVLSNMGGGTVNYSVAAEAPWITDVVRPAAWGGYMDAGDWDRRAQHMSASYLLLDVFENISERGRQRDYNIPASDTVLDKRLYGGADLPDIVDEAVWNLDFFRRMQRADGAVSGGVESGGGSPRMWEPCWLESQTVFAYAPDAGASYSYAASAAKLAIVLRGLGKERLSETYMKSAVAAWNWAEAAMLDPEAGLGPALSKLNLSLVDRQAAVTRSRNAFLNGRLWAAGSLFRLTGEAAYDTVVRARYGAGWFGLAGMAGDGMWEYINAKDADLKIQNDVRFRIVEATDRYMVQPQLAKVSYRSMKHGGAPLWWGEGGAPNQDELSQVIRAYLISPSKDFLRVMQDASAHILGANQVGKSLTIGLGKRWPVAPLHADSIASGEAPPNGITIYGWVQQQFTNYGWIWWSPWAALPQSDPTRSVDPHWRSLPIYEYLVEYPTNIMSNEYTVNQTIATTAAMWIFLDGYQK